MFAKAAPQSRDCDPGYASECVGTEREQSDMKKLLDDRNPVLADGIDRLHAGGQRGFTAVGALHMTGPLALPGLLRARGLVVNRVY